MDNKKLQELLAPDIPPEGLEQMYAEMSENESDGGYDIIDVSKTPSIPEAIFKAICAEIAENDPTRVDSLDTSELIAPETETSSPYKIALDTLENVHWDDVERIHPMLDFTEDTAYVAANLDFDMPVQQKDGATTTEVVNRPFIIGSNGFFAHGKDFSKLADSGITLEIPLSTVPYRWNKHHLKSFLEGTTELDPGKLFEGIRSCFQKYLYFEEEGAYNFITLWVIGTYLYPLFDAYPMVLLCGPKGSGKTRTLTVASFLAFNAHLQGDPTPATTFRTIDAERPTLFFDEMEWLYKRNLDTRMSAMLKFGYKKGFKIPRCTIDSKGNYDVKYFDSYCPKMFANINGLEDVLGDRTITFYQKRKTSDQNIETSDPSEYDPIWSELRHYLHVFLLTHWSDVKRLLSGKNKTTIHNRDLELFSPIFALAKFFEEYGGQDNLYNDMVTLSELKCAEKKASDIESNRESLMIQALVSIVTGDTWYSISDIITEMKKFFTSDKTDWINETSMGRAMSRLGFKEKERRNVTLPDSGTKKLTHYLIFKHKIKELARAYHVPYTDPNPPSAEDERIMDSWSV